MYVYHVSLCHIAATFHGERSREEENDEEEEYDTDCENSGKSYIMLTNHKSVFIDVSQSRDRSFFSCNWLQCLC